MWSIAAALDPRAPECVDAVERISGGYVAFEHGAPGMRMSPDWSV
jgi:hypothetical protein